MKIFQSLNDDKVEEEKVYSLAYPLSKFDSYEEQIEANIDDAVDNELSEKLCDVEKRKHLFANYRFWLNREVPKDALAIVIRLFLRSLQIMCILSFLV